MKKHKTSSVDKEDKRVQDFLAGVNQLCKDTGLKISSFDWSEAMLETPEGKLFFFCGNPGEYYVEPEARQANIKTD